MKVARAVLLLFVGWLACFSGATAQTCATGSTAVAVVAAGFVSCVLLVSKNNFCKKNIGIIPDLSWITELFARRRTTRPSSAGATTSLGNWGKATSRPGAALPTVLAHRAPPPRVSCRPRVR